jgi:uncharacterized protein involved in type VI secretion and phage assembly
MNDIILKVAGITCSLAMSRLRVLQQINEIPSALLELQIPTDNNGTSDAESLTMVGQFVTGSNVVIELDGTTLFNGYLTQKRLLLQGKVWTVRLEARHVLQKMVFAPRSRVFRQQDDVTILNTLFQQAGIKVSHITTQQNTRHDQMVQFRVSDWQYISSRLFATNCWLIPDITGENITIAPLLAPIASHTLERYADHSGYSVYEIDLTFDNRFTPNSLSLRGWDITQQQLVAAKQKNSDAFSPWQATVSEVMPVQGLQDYQLAFSNMPETMLSTLSQSWMNHQQLTGVQGRIVLDGTRDFRLGESVALKKFGAGLDSTVLITGIQHLFDGENGWRCELQVGMPARLPDPVPSVQSLQIATVVEFTPDPQNLDRIPISLPALDLPGEYIFARLGKPWASKDSGFCFYPEPGDELVVGFIENDPRYPIILDSLHNPKNNTPLAPDQRNKYKGLVINKDAYTAQLLIDTQEQKLTLSTSNKMSLHGGTLVEITSPSIDMEKS